MKIHRIFPNQSNELGPLTSIVDNLKMRGYSALWMPLEKWQKASDHLTDWPLGFSKLCEVQGADEEDRLSYWRACVDSFGMQTSFDRVIFIFTQFPSLSIFNELKSHPKAAILFRPKSLQSAEEICSHIPNETNENVYFEFLPWSKKEPFRATPSEIRTLIAKTTHYKPNFRIKTYPGLDVWDDRMTNVTALTVDENKSWYQKVNTSEPRISVVIPTYNNLNFVQSVVLNLIEQSLPSSEYEVIVVDDGSSDGTGNILRELVKQHERAINFSYLLVPRQQQRILGDDQYRAGIARNQGAQRATGTFLQFLDSDIIVRPQFLERILDTLQEADVVQCQRLHIFPNSCTGIQRYEDVDQNKDLFVEDESYWAPFFITDDWMSLPHFWKFTCTYALGLARKDFFEIGQFKHSFTTYGFEDVDLGYELAKKKKRFKLLKERTLHLTPQKCRSEYAHSKVKRHQLLSRSAKTFFRQHLDPEIYDLMPTFMMESKWWPRLMASMT